MRNPLHLLLSSCLLVVACNRDAAPASEATSAPLQAPSTPTAAGARYTFDQSNSQVTWVGAKLSISHDGAFETFSGSIDLVDNEPTKSSVAVDIATASVTTSPDRLVSHLKTADFFDVATYPTAKFRSTAIAAGGGTGTHTITGELDLHGVKKTLQFPATIRVQPDVVEAEAEFPINRKDFGIVYPGAPDDLVKDEVKIKLKLRANKAS